MPTRDVICPNCDHRFSPNGNQRLMEREGRCEFCGELFETSSRVRRFCSRHCQLEAIKARRREMWG